MSKVLVIFQANTERMEQFALAVALGAVEAEANIRLRRLTVAGSPEVGHKGYGVLGEADLIWADTIVVGLEDPQPSEELEGLLSVLNAADKTSFRQKQAWTFGTEGSPTAKTQAQSYIEAALQRAEVTVWPAVVATAMETTTLMKESGRQLAQRG